MERDINVVLKGSEEGEKIWDSGKGLVTTGRTFTKEYVQSYTVLDETTTESFSAFDGFIGQLIYGDMGFLLGQNGNQEKKYLIAIEWKYPGVNDEMKSLICLDYKYYRILVTDLF